jgi:endo-1,4-beta-D-glucanase Y
MLIRRNDGPLDFGDLAQPTTPAYGAMVGTSRRMHRSSALLGRRAVLGGAASLGTIASPRAQAIPICNEWQSFKSHYLSDDGRIVDNGNGGESHSEGQGWGLLFSVAAQDQASFDLILNWTSRVLRRPGDTLHAWRYGPKDTPAVKDLNNAVDGDLFIAAALIRAGRSWGRPDYLQAAAAIGSDILRLLVRRVGSLTVLLPGIEGFEIADAIIVNPSYYAFPMMAELAEIQPSLQWDEVQRDGKTLLERGRFGRWSLPPDWLRIAKADGSLSVAPGWPPRFSYDAIRVPLWWNWQKLPLGPMMLSLDGFWSGFPAGAVPAWVDLKTNEVAPYPASPGIAAVVRLMRATTGAADSAPASACATTYYDAALILLAHMAEIGTKLH